MLFFVLENSVNHVVLISGKIFHLFLLNYTYVVHEVFWLN